MIYDPFFHTTEEDSKHNGSAIKRGNMKNKQWWCIHWISKKKENSGSKTEHYYTSETRQAKCGKTHGKVQNALSVRIWEIFLVKPEV